jgi:hypothetical protein
MLSISELRTMALFLIANTSVLENKELHNPQNFVLIRSVLMPLGHAFKKEDSWRMI